MSSQRTDPVVITLNCEAQPSIDTAEIDRAEWDAMTPQQRAVEVQTLASEHMNNSGGYGWHINDPDDYAAVGEPPAPPAPIDADEVMRMVEEYGVLRGTVATLVTYPGMEEAAQQRDREAAQLRDKIRKAVTR
ncbi:hypothetical protein ABZ388_06940 [Micromonospora parva]|uniref:DUF7167 family protein n=1 Tax=Micromonospora parva TaxID=1464048 RepID=UPI0033CF95C5